MNGTITSTVIQKLKQIATPQRVADLLGIEQKRYGRRISILCPVHNDKHYGSCYLTEQGFKCFSCGESRDVIGMVQAVRNCDFKDAVTYLCTAFGVEIGAGRETIPKPISLLDKETLAFLGIVSRPNEASGYAIERIVDVVDEDYPAEKVPKGYRLEWHPFTFADIDTDLYIRLSTDGKPNGFCYLKEIIETNPLRVLYEENEELYHSLIYNKASEKLSIFKEMKKWVIDHLPSSDTRNMILKALISDCKLCNRLMTEHGPCKRPHSSRARE